MSAPARIVLPLALLALACDRPEPPPAPAGPPAVVEVSAPAPLVVPIGSSVELPLTVSVAAGFRIQANPASQPYLVPARLELEPDDGVHLGPVVYPPGTPYRLQGASEDLSTYEGSFEIRVAIGTTPDARPGDRLLRGTLRYQACNARMCLAPATTPVEVRLRLVPSA